MNFTVATPGEWITGGLKEAGRAGAGRLLRAGAVETGPKTHQELSESRQGPGTRCGRLGAGGRGSGRERKGTTWLETPSGGWGQRQVWRLGRRGGAFCFSLGEGAGPIGPPGRRAQERAGAHRTF